MFLGWCKGNKEYSIQAVKALNYPHGFASAPKKAPKKVETVVVKKKNGKTVVVKKVNGRFVTTKTIVRR